MGSRLWGRFIGVFMLRMGSHRRFRGSTAARPGPVVLGVRQLPQAQKFLGHQNKKKKLVRQPAKENPAKERIRNSSSLPVFPKTPSPSAVAARRSPAPLAAGIGAATEQPTSVISFPKLPCAFPCSGLWIEKINFHFHLFQLSWHCWSAAHCARKFFLRFRLAFRVLSSMPPIRKQLSGAEKRKKKQKEDALIQSQVGSLNKYFKSNQIAEQSEIAEQVNQNDIDEIAEQVNQNDIDEIAEQVNQNDIDDKLNDKLSSINYVARKTKWISYVIYREKNC